MSYKRSILVGIFLVTIVLIITVLIFYLSNDDKCPPSTFECINSRRICVPQHVMCTVLDECINQHRELCGLHYGSTSLVESIHSDSVSLFDCSIEGYPVGCMCMKGTALFCDELNLTDIPSVSSNVSMLYLERNSIQLTDDSLNGLNLTHRLDLGSNNITKFPSRPFATQRHLEQLFLRRNRLRRIPRTVFAGLVSLKWLLVPQNLLEDFPLEALNGLRSLQWLNLAHNRLTLKGERFPLLPNITEIDLSYNCIEKIKDTLFPRLSRLHLLNLNHNRISFVHPSAFIGLTDLRELRISENRLIFIPDRVFSSLISLDALFIGGNNLTIGANILQWANISYLDLRGTPQKDIDFSYIAKKSSIEAIFFAEFYYCSFTPAIRNCMPSTDGVSTLEDLLSKPVLRYATWSMATVTCIGNALVLWGRFTHRDESRAVSMVIRNLAVADMLMGFYLSVIGVQDYRFREKYNAISFAWVGSWSCIGAGILAMISSEVSLLILTFISVERFLLIADPFGGHRRLTMHNVLLFLFTIWLTGIAIAIWPVIHWRDSTQYYGTYSGTCFPLHLRQRFPLGWEYSAVVFMGINMFLLLLIAVLYTALLVSIWRTRRATPLAVFDCEFAIRFFFIVLVDTSCWAPIIVSKLFVSVTKYEISADVYAFLVVFVLPLNSAVNPLLYTFTTPKYRNQVLLRGWNKLTSRKTTRTEGSAGTGSNNSNQGRSLQSNISRSRRAPNSDEHGS